MYRLPKMYFSRWKIMPIVVQHVSSGITIEGDQNAGPRDWMQRWHWRWRECLLEAVPIVDNWPADVPPLRSYNVYFVPGGYLQGHRKCKTTRIPVETRLCTVRIGEGPVTFWATEAEPPFRAVQLRYAERLAPGEPITSL